MPIFDPFDDNAAGLESPASNAIAVIPSDTEDLPVRPRAIMANTAGAVAMTFGENTVTLTLAEGVPYPFRPTRILATGTTATGLHLFW